MAVVARTEQLPVQEARRQDPAAWDVLFKRYQMPLYVYVFELVHDEQASLDVVQETFDLENQTVAPEAVDRLANTMQAEFTRFHPYTFYARIAVHTSRAVQAGARNQAMVQAAMTACALERYHLNHGTYPEALSGLVPRYLAEVPKDPIGGEPLKYRLSASGYLLYSIGWNQMDNGGIIAPTSATAALPKDSASNTGDWVWR